ncbi:PREDICTED: uncharacterized protein LOC101297499 [Fragaria vesca subsp. vesca]
MLVMIQDLFVYLVQLIAKDLLSRTFFNSFLIHRFLLKTRKQFRAESYYSYMLIAVSAELLDPGSYDQVSPEFECRSLGVRPQLKCQCCLSHNDEGRLRC